MVPLAVVPVTVTVNVHLLFADIVPPVTVMVLVAAVDVKLFVPPQTEDVPSLIDKPAGKTSVTATPVNAVARFGFVMVKLRLVVLPVRTYVAPNDFSMDGGATTVRLLVP